MDTLIRAVLTLVNLLLNLYKSVGLTEIATSEDVIKKVWPDFVRGVTELLSSIGVDLGPFANNVAAFVKDFGVPIGNVVENDLTAFASNWLTSILPGAGGVGESTADNAISAAAAGYVRAFGFGLSSFAVSAIFESVFPEKLNTLNGVGPILASLAGFAEISKVVLGPLYDNAFGKSLDYKFRSLYKPELPAEPLAVQMHARRLLTDDQLKAVFEVSGLKSQYETPFIANAYRAVQPRALTTLYQDVPFPTAQVQSMLEFAGIRPVDVPILLNGMELASTKNVRQQYVSAIVTAAERGTLNDSEVESDLNDLGFSTDAIGLVKLTIATRKLEQLAELYRKEISELYLAGLLTDAQYVPSLEAIGIAAADANAHYAVDSAKLHGRQAATAARAAARQAAQQTRASSNAAIENYRQGNINELELGAALITAGVPAELVPAIVDLNQVRRQTKYKPVYGLSLLAKDAQLLKAQIAAIGEQVYKKLITPAAGFAAVRALGVPRDNAIPLISKFSAEAGLAFTPPA